ncbi:zinc finger protein 653 isoform X1 [Fundulus heteroclitus]|uniref:zinc finger protein 653 isoform X1 n=1 Tax=Fundulus heteroclitus TaxID=8078 RepID=UPI00165B10F9|nr:zinc finger protein 653 isoform X1 [Fundulus heteroclitus]
MAYCQAGCPSEADRTGERGAPRRCRGRPRLTDSDRAQRRLESRKKYDVRRVYLGESHKLWSELRRRTSLSDAGLAEYLILLNSTYGDKYRQESCGKKTAAEGPGKRKGGRKQRVSSLQSLVSWYREHSASCPHEPQLRALEPRPDRSTAAVWKCLSDHSFVQYLYSPPKEASDSEHEERGNGDSDGEAAHRTDPLAAKGTGASRQRRKEGPKKCKGEVIGSMNQTEEDGDQNHQPRTEASSQDTTLMGQAAWDTASLHSASAEEEEEEEEEAAALEDVAPSTDEEGAREKLRKEELTFGPGCEYDATAASLPEDLDTGNQDSQSLNGPVPLSAQQERGAPPAAQVQEPAEPFEPQPLQTVVTGCQIPNQRTALEGSQGQPRFLWLCSGATSNQSESSGVFYANTLLFSDWSRREEKQEVFFFPEEVQEKIKSGDIKMKDHMNRLIIITGPGYEALASEGVQLNMASGNMEEVTCTVIGGVPFNQLCTPDFKVPAAPEEDSLTGLSETQLVPNTVDNLELSSDRELQRSLSSVRSKRNRRGPVIEADGMLKMFHCPYEGCSQVYVAISSFQNHVNLVHRKGRTKVCPHPGCGKKFYLSNHLHRHMIIHSGVRDFICETCGKSFKRKNHLEVHRRTHTGETPLQCEICGYQCRQRASLNWHMKKHTPEALYNFTCEFCDKRFEKLDSVKFHKLKSHPEKQTT